METGAVGRERLRAKLSYTNIGFALAPGTFSISELRGLYRAALGHDVIAMPDGDMRAGAVTAAGIIDGVPIACADWRRHSWAGVT